MAKNLNVSLAFTANASQAKAELNALKKSLNELVSGTALKTPDFKFTKDIQDATRAAAQLKVQLDSAMNVKTGNLDLTKFSESMAKSGMSLEKYQNQLYQLGPAGEKAFADLTRSITMADVPLKRSNKLLSELWTTMKNTARWQLTSSAMHGFMGAVQSAYGYAQDLNESLNEIRIVTGASTDKMAEFAKEANSAAKALSTTTTNYTNASLIFYQQGLTDSQVKERTDITIKMANAAGASAEKVSDQLTAVWNNFYDGSKSLEYYADVMTALGAATASSTDEISEGLQKFAAVADTVGLSYEYATAALATITSNTRESADVVGNALKTLFARIQGLQLGETLEDGTDLNKYSQALDKVGISIYDANGGLKTMDDTLDEMAAKWDTLSNVQQTALAQAVAGVRQYTQLIALMENWNNGDSDSMVANLQTVDNASGALQEQADIYADSWEASSKRVKASLEAVYSSLLNDKFFIGLNNGIADVVDGVKIFIDSLGGVKGLLLAIGSVVTNVFSKQIAQSLQNAAFSLKGLFNPNAILEQEMAQKKKANELLVSGLKDQGTTSSGYSAQAYKALGENQLSYIQNAERMSEEEKAINQLLLDRNRTLADNAIKAGEELEQVENRITAERNSLVFQAQKAGQGSPEQIKSVRDLSKQYEDLTKTASRFQTIANMAFKSSGMDENAEDAKALKKDLSEVVQEMLNLKDVDKLSDANGIEKLTKSLHELIPDINMTQEEINELWQVLKNSDSISFERLTEIFNKLSISSTQAGTTIEAKLKTAMQACGMTTEQVEATMKEYNAILEQFEDKNEGAEVALRKVISAMKDHNAEMDKTKQKPISYAEAFTKASSAIMAVGQAINTVRGIIDVFRNEEASTGEKILALVTGIGMLVPAIMSVVGAFSQVPVAAAGANAALIATEVNAVQAGVAISTAMWQVTLIAMAIAAVVAIIIACADAMHKASPEGQFEAATKAAEQAADAASKVQEEYQEVINTLDGLDSGIEKIHEMERGTLQWRQAIIDSNNSLIELLSTYGMLDSSNFTVDADGLMQITNAAREALIEAQMLAVEAANQSNYAAQVNKNTAESRRDASNTAGELTLLRTDAEGYTYDALMDNSQLSADVGMAIAEAMAQGRLTNEDLVNKEDSSNLARVLSEVAGLYEGEAELLAKQITASESLATAFGELGASVTAATEANRILNNQIIDSEFNDNIKNSGLDENIQSDLTNMMGSILDQSRTDLYNSEFRDGAGMKDKDIQKLYAEAMGWDAEKTKNKGGNKATYYDKQGNVVAENLDDTVARTYLAQQEALKQMSGNIDAYIATLKELLNVGNLIGDGVGEALSSFAGGQQGDFSNLNQKQLDNLSNSITGVEDPNNVTSFNIGDIVVDEAYAKQLGWETVQAYYDAIQAEIEATNNQLDISKIAEGMTVKRGDEVYKNTAGDHFTELFDNTADLDTMTAEAKTTFAEAYESIFKHGGEDALNLVDSLIASSGDKASEMAQLIAETDWTSWDSADGFIERMQEAGIEIEGFDATSFITQMKEMHNATKDFNLDEFRSQFAEVNKIVSDLEFGDVISAEDFNKLGEGYDEYFTLMADGTYKLTSDAAEFYNTVMKNQREDLINNIKASSAEFSKKETKINEIGDIDSSTIGNKTVFTNDEGQTVYDQQKANQQVDFIEQMNDGTYSSDQIAMWREEITGERNASIEILNEIAAAAQERGAEYNTMLNSMVTDQAAMEASIQAIFTTVTSLDELNAAAEQVNNALGGAGFDYQHYADGLIVLASEYEHCTDEIKEYQAALANGTDEQIKSAETALAASVAVGEEAEMYDLAVDQVEAIADAFLDLAEAGEEQYESLKDDAEGLKDAAVRYARLQDAVLDLSENYDDYKDVLKDIHDASDDIDKAMIANSKNGKALQKSLAGLLGTSEDLIDADLLAAIDPDDFEKAAEGDEEAIERIRDAFIDLQTEAYLTETEMASLKEELAGLTEGAVFDIDNTPMLYKLIEARLAAGASAADIEALLSGFDIDADVTDFVGSMQQMADASASASSAVIANTSFSQTVDQVTAETPEVSEEVAYSTSYQPTTIPRYNWVLKDGMDQPQLVMETRTQWTKTVNPEVVPTETTQEQVGTSVTTENAAGESAQVKGVQINNARKSSGSSVGGSTKKQAGSNKGGGGGGGGGGGSAPKPAEKVDVSKKSDFGERYHTINKQIDNMGREMERASKAADKLWSRKRLKYLEEQNKMLDEEIALLQEKTRQAEEYLEQDTADLNSTAADLGFTISYGEDGEILNYDAIRDAYAQQMIEAQQHMNSLSTKEEQDAYQESVIDPLQKKIDAFEEAMKLYYDSLETIEENADLIQEKLDQKLQNNFDIWAGELELDIEVNERDLELIEYYLGKIEDDVYQMAEAAALMVGSLDGMKSGNFGGQLGEYLSNLDIYKTKLDELNEKFAAGEITEAAYEEGLEQIRSGILDNLQSVQELDDAMLEYYSDTLSAVMDEMDKYTDKLEHQTAILEHYANMMEILGKSYDYESMGVILEGQVKTIENELKVAEAEYDLYQKEAEEKRKLYEEAVKAGNVDAAEVYKKEWEAAEEAAIEAQSEMLDKTEQWAEAMRAVVENKLKGFAQDLEKSLTGGTTFDQINLQLERAAALQEEYLTTTNKIYETNKLMRTAQQEMDKTSNSVAKQRLKDFIKETNQLQDKSKLSKYELEIQQAKYDLLLAQLALEDAQNAKSMVRLQRDSEGNFGYVYTADQNKLLEAQQALEDAQNNLYNIGLEGANDYTEKYAETMQEMYDTLTSITEAYYNGEIASHEEYEAQMLAAQQYYYEQLENYQDLYGIALQTDTRVIKDAWSTGMQIMTIETSDWQNAVETYTNKATETLVAWYAQVDAIANKTGLDNIANKVKKVTDESDKLKETILGSGNDKGVIGALADELDAVSNLTGGYANLRAELQSLIEDYEELIKTVLKIQNTPDGPVVEGETVVEDEEVKPEEEPEEVKPEESLEDNVDPSTPILKKGDSVTVKKTATHFSRNGGNGTRMRSFVPGSTYNVMDFDDDEVMIGRNGIVTGWVKKTDLVGFNTGGYTGSWGPYGKLAILDEKELVLNQGDTANFLASMEVLERILEMIDIQSASAQLGGLLTTPAFGGNNSSSNIEQNVHIEASFPGVTDRNEIEEAFNNLINTASQYANRKI